MNPPQLFSPPHARIPPMTHSQRSGGSKPSTDRRFISELGAQANVDQHFLVTHKQLRPNRNGQLYLQVDLSDKTGSITARMWNAGEADYSAFEDGDYVRIEGTTQLFSGQLQLIATLIQRVDPARIDESDFRVLAPAEIAAFELELQQIIETIQDSDLRALAAAVTADTQLMEAFRRSPAGVKQHHAHVGGLLEHVVSLLRLAEKVAPLYPAVNRDLLLVGVLYHDIGKVIELESEKGFSYTDAGQLLGHVLLGLELLEEKIREVSMQQQKPFDPEMSLRVKHMVASHHGQYEFGAPKLPMTLEAIALHHLDNLDARLNGVLQLMRDEGGVDGAWTQYQTTLGRKFFKGRSEPVRTEATRSS
ncbi:MAG: HD domain-containing protein [Planctomycetota bacterium]|nr:MAG: HD domain-containing protein [Planctomycetota bacterium]TSA08127.1 MAG: HD domain-containing protein [Planctomycetaceae bacterium]